MIKSYNKEALHEVITSGRKVYLYFHLNGCGPCRSVLPTLEKFAEHNEVYKIESTDDPELKDALKSTSYPALVVLEDQVIWKNVNGVNAITQILSEYGESNK